MKKKQNKRTTILIVILLGLVIIAYKVMFAPANIEDSFIIEENITASDRVEELLEEIKNVSFDTSVIQNEKFQSLKSIETPLISLPVGKNNPFSDS